MKMNPQSDGFWTHFWATITALFSAAGLTTEQWIYVFCAIFGALLSFNSYLNNKRALKERQNEDEKRTEILRSYLAGRKNNAEVVPANVAEEVKDVMNKVGT
ncbi:hypothetical protein [Rouxiella badensis]|jgi:hypothetical protein|uniref:Holin n=1 Tax=Rouxiella badensis TaxID=1646377 RepID=A0A1X0WG79_9GAMM|nr:hypothetical protein [Rouxiella badensis]MCC3701203.1 hypothetical protein [Rouxiella badensis]MCC3717630.1 hypothetical protein [Rouxiella badensis]MCC3727426.1 hypothetical protein [Rouxiella badensis]MCC3732628.1 hypothetical protein [Rouxiella badensis]MCC3738974.1 hypothetical protein [Rouxiella badensis]